MPVASTTAAIVVSKTFIIPASQKMGGLLLFAGIACTIAFYEYIASKKRTDGNREYNF